MRQINYWEQFMATGKVDDFLAYKNAMRDEGQDQEEAEEHSHAGDYRDYGNDYKG